MFFASCRWFVLPSRLGGSWDRFAIVIGWLIAPVTLTHHRYWLLHCGTIEQLIGPKLRVMSLLKSESPAATRTIKALTVSWKHVDRLGAVLTVGTVRIVDARWTVPTSVHTIRVRDRIWCIPVRTKLAKVRPTARVKPWRVHLVSLSVASVRTWT